MRRLIVFAVLLGALGASEPSHAALRGDRLAQRLATLGPDDSVSVILQFADRADLSRFPGRRSDGRAVIETLRAHAGRSQGRVLAFLRARGLGDRVESFWIDNSTFARVPVALLPELERFDELDRIDADEGGAGDGAPVHTVSSAEWNLLITRVDQVWSTHGFDGTGIVVGSMDTGFDPAHPALQGRWRGGANSWRDIVAGSPTPYDDNGHGTHTIGTMVGGDGPGPFTPDVGVAYNARFIAVKVLDASNSFSSSATVIGGAQWMLDPDGNPATDDFPHVINNSWLFFDPLFQGFHASTEAWRAVGIIPVFCIGNSGPTVSTTRVPGNYDNTIGVGATDVNDAIASFSSRGPSPLGTGFPADQRKPDLSAPGAAVLSCVPGGGYAHFFGTSMASPHVAGTVALMLQANPGMSYDEVRATLLATSVDRGTLGYDDAFGYGRLDALPAVTGALSPTAHVTAAATGNEIMLGWNSVPGALHYEVHRGTQPQDPAPVLIATTTDTTYTDVDRFGRYYYRLRTVGPSGASPFTNEATVTACGLSGPNANASDASTQAPVIADFNGDGHPDVALASLSSGTVKVSLGDGGGGFSPIVSFAAGSRPSGLAIADFDGNGIRDLAVTNNVNAGTVSILLGNGTGGLGDGTFAAPVAYATALRPVGVTCADFNQDGIDDLAVANNGSNTCSILLGNGAAGVGDGTFAAAVGYATSTKPSGLVAGDFTGDGALDLAIAANGGARVSVLIGNRDAVRADGTFTVGTPAFSELNPVGIVTGDFNSDGRLDVAVACNVSPGFVSVLFGREAGPGESVFATGVDHPAGPLAQGIAAADWNGDGISDLAVACAATNGPIAVLLGTGVAGAGDGGFEKPTTFVPGGSPTDLAIADFDHDGDPDLAMANLSSAQSLLTTQATCGAEVGTELTLLTPNGGESWPVSTTQAITWSKGPGVVAVDVEVSRDGGATWRTIATQQPGTGVPWTVTEPQTAAATTRVRVHDARVSRADTSDAGFTVGPDFRLSAPGAVAEGLHPALTIENPAIDGLRVRLRLGAQEPARIDVMDASGRRVRSQSLGSFGPGEQKLDLGRGLTPGLYWVRLTQGAARITRKAAVVR